MVRRNANKFFLGTATAVGLVAAVVMVIGHLTAEAQVRGQKGAGRKPQRDMPPIQVGTYDAEAVFQAHPAQREMEQALTRAQNQMQQAQQQGDQQRMEQIQQQFEQSRGRAIQQYQQDVSRIVPEVADAAGVQLVAMEIVYKADHVKTIDITDRVREGLANLGGKRGKVKQPVPQFQLPKQ